MEETCFSRGVMSTCVPGHSQKIARGSTRTILGWEWELNWSNVKLSERFRNKHRGRFGPANDHDESIITMNRNAKLKKDVIHLIPICKHKNMTETDLPLTQCILTWLANWSTVINLSLIFNPLNYVSMWVKKIWPPLSLQSWLHEFHTNVYRINISQ